MSASARPPVIIIGMHRSGTSMLCRLLESLGLFVGVCKEWNHESFFFFQIINEWLLRRCNAAYESPQRFRLTLNSPEARSATVNRLARFTRSPWVMAFLGWRKYWRYRTLHNLELPWGWKDPRNTFTLPLWLDVFPQAKVIHVYRHGVDVAQSLRIRRRRWLNRAIAFCDEIRLRSWLQPDRGASLHTRRLTTLEGGFSLWEEYMEEARGHVMHLKTQAMEVKYEDLLASPQAHLQALERFCGLQATASVMDRTVESLQAEKAYRHRGSSQLMDFSDQVAERLRQYGY